MKILVTGADGFLGTNVIRLLLEDGFDVNAFVQPGRDPFTLAGLDINIFRGDLLDKDNIANAIDGCDYLIHTAACTQLWPARAEIIWQVNEEGTKNIIEAARNTGVKKIVYVGTANSFGSGSKKDPADETKPRDSEKYKLDYMDSKYAAHQFIMKEARENNLPAVIVNPTMMIGRYDSLSGFCAMMVAVHEGKSPGYSAGGRNYIYVKDAARGIINALDKGHAGECYILGNANLSYKEIFDEIASVIGAKAPKRKIPKAAVKAYGLIGSVKGSATKKAPTVSFAMARLACDDNYYSAQKAIEEIDLQQTPIRYAIEESYQWCLENNFLKNANKKSLV